MDSINPKNMKYMLLISSLYIVFLSCNTNTKRDIRKTGLESETLSDSIITYDTKMFDFEPDIRLFTTMSFANASGYDQENTEMTKERLEIRSYLDSVLTPDFKEKISGISKNEIFASFGHIAFSLSYPPRFGWLPDSLSVTNRPPKSENYLALLNEFYSATNIPDLWKKYEEKFRTENYAYIPYSTKGIEDIVSFCRVNKDYFGNKQFVFNICPLLPNNSGFTCYSEAKIFIIVSPREAEPGPAAFYHEALHHIVNPIVDKNYDQLTKLGGIEKVGWEVRMQMNGAYLGRGDFFSECMVRTIDYMLRGKYYGWSKEKIKEEIGKQYNLGLTLIPFFYEKLSEYEKTSMTLEEYLPTIIRQVDIGKEEKRWNDFQQNK